MAPPPKIGGVFSPPDLAQMALAYDIALRVASGKDCSLAIVPGRELRHRLASFIVGAARQGPRDADFLAQTALEGLQRLTAHAPLHAYLD